MFSVIYVMYLAQSHGNPIEQVGGIIDSLLSIRTGVLFA